MSGLIDRLRADFQDQEYRHSYAEACLNTMIATQLKVLREQREMTQDALGKKSGMLQPRIHLLEDASYSNWTISTLKRLAKAFDLALTVRFDAFSDVILDFESLSKESLERPSFRDDPLFQSQKVRTSGRFRRRRSSIEAEKIALQGIQMNLFTAKVTELPNQVVTHRQDFHKTNRPQNLVNPVIVAAQQGGTDATGFRATG